MIHGLEFNLLWPGDTIGHQLSLSTLAVVMAWQHHSIKWISVDFPLVKSFGIRLRAIAQEVPELLLCIMSLKITLLKLLLSPRDQWIYNIGVTSIYDIFIAPPPYHPWKRQYFKYVPHDNPRADSRLVPSQWEMSLQSNDVSHWLSANLKSAL